MGPLVFAAALAIHGTRLPPEGWNATTLVTIRQRVGMNAVRISAEGQDWRHIADLVRLANRLELTVIIDSDEAPATVAGNPNVWLAVSSAEALRSARAAGVKTPIIARGFIPEGDGVIREVTPRWSDEPNWPGPTLVDGLDPNFHEAGAECGAFPSDPGAASRLVQMRLRQFQERGISWTISSFRPSHLITDWRYLIGTKLDDGWTCGDSGMAGLGLELLAHLRGADPHGLFAVNGDAGNYRLPIGGRATAYGPIMAERERIAGPGPLPFRLENVSVRITDSRGVAHRAPLLYTGAGWAHITFLIPESAAEGPAEIALERTDGTRSIATAVLGRAAPGLLSASVDGRGVAKASWSEHPAYECAADCVALPIPAGAAVRLVGTGFRHARSVRVTIGDSEARVVSYGPIQEPGRDQLIVEMTDGSGETDLMMWADGVLSNVVRVRLGGRVQPPASVTPSPASPRSPRTASGTRRSPAGPSAQR